MKKAGRCAPADRRERLSYFGRLKLPRRIAQQFLLIYTEAMAKHSRAVPRRWKPDADRISLRPSADALGDAAPLLLRILEALGTNAAARLLDVDRAQVS